MPQDRPPGPSSRLTPAVLARLTEVVGPSHALTDPDMQSPFLVEWRRMYQGRTPVVLRPGTVDEVARILAIAHEAGVAVVPQSGNTGLVGGQTPLDGTAILVSLARLDRIRAVDAAGGTMTVEAGVTLADVRAAASDADRLFPLSLPSEDTCRIGGNLATNAGGTGVLAYGNTRSLVLGVEVVLADGRVWNGLRALKKDNAGYDLKDLFIGSEGTLGLITVAVLKLFPKPAEAATALVALDRISDALALLALAQGTSGTALTAFEFVPRIALEFVTRHTPGTRDPFAKAHPWYVLLEISGAKPDGRAGRELEVVLTDASERGLLVDAVIATSLTHAKALWRLREAISEAQRHEGGNIKHDISVPVARIPEFIDRADAAVARLSPGARPIPLGHFGDGNVHYNVAQPPGMDARAFLALWEPMSEAVHAIVTDMGGSIAAEHGVGRLKRDWLPRYKSPIEMELMHRVKAALDPKGILNPGVVLRSE
ncbi:MAG: FAD-binding oxidoreductase [Hyphomicrobiaceae bacterium]